MKIKRFLAPNMRDAIRLVREEQGPDAVILSNRRVEGGVEVIAATDYDAALVQSAAMRSEGPLPSPQSQPPARPEPEETPRLLKPAPADPVSKEALQRAVAGVGRAPKSPAARRAGPAPPRGVGPGGTPP
ncbi:MAG: flagellar biosynthesis protein FlhF, partial [Panacagrimonas sp.]